MGTLESWDVSWVGFKGTTRPAGECIAMTILRIDMRKAPRRTVQGCATNTSSFCRRWGSRGVEVCPEAMTV